MPNEFENALAWFCSAPGEWIKSGRKNLAAGVPAQKNNWVK